MKFVNAHKLTLFFAKAIVFDPATTSFKSSYSGSNKILRLSVRSSESPESRGVSNLINESAHCLSAFNRSVIAGDVISFAAMPELSWIPFITIRPKT